LLPRQADGCGPLTIEKNAFVIGTDTHEYNWIDIRRAQFMALVVIKPGANDDKVWVFAVMD
jgi:hypothetical protein